MRGDVYVREVLEKCDALKKARLWMAEPRMRPYAWLKNFEDVDQPIAALLLDNFTFYGDGLTDRLLVSSYASLGDRLPKGPQAPDGATILRALDAAIFTRVEGERPRPTDSGNLFCRKARQVLGIPDGRFLEPAVALQHAAKSTPVVFIDDFVGSGDQFLSTWQRSYSATLPRSFADVSRSVPFVAVYVTLIATDFGLRRIRAAAPHVAITTAHELDESATVRRLTANASFAIADVPSAIRDFLEKYAPRLSPPQDIAKDPSWIRYGYKERGLMFAFEHSVPDATLPIFWAAGGRDWNQLVERC